MTNIPDLSVHHRQRALAERMQQALKDLPRINGEHPSVTMDRAERALAQVAEDEGASLRESVGAAMSLGSTRTYHAVLLVVRSAGNMLIDQLTKDCGEQDEETMRTASALRSYLNAVMEASGEAVVAAVSRLHEDLGRIGGHSN